MSPSSEVPRELVNDACAGGDHTHRRQRDLLPRRRRCWRRVRLHAHVPHLLTTWSLALEPLSRPVHLPQARRHLAQPDFLARLLDAFAALLPEEDVGPQSLLRRRKGTEVHERELVRVEPFEVVEVKVERREDEERIRVEREPQWARHGRARGLEHAFLAVLSLSQRV